MEFSAVGPATIGVGGSVSQHVHLTVWYSCVALLVVLVFILVVRQNIPPIVSMRCVAHPSCLTSLGIAAACDSIS
jgi:hypothetical protein